MPKKIKEAQALEILVQIFRQKLHLSEEIDLLSVSRQTEGGAWSSLRHADLLLCVENKLEIQFSYQEIVEANSFSYLKKVVLEKLKDSNEF